MASSTQFGAVAPELSRLGSFYVYDLTDPGEPQLLAQLLSRGDAAALVDAFCAAARAAETSRTLIITEGPLLAVVGCRVTPS